MPTVVNTTPFTLTGATGTITIPSTTAGNTLIVMIRAHVSSTTAISVSSIALGTSGDTFIADISNPHIASSLRQSTFTYRDQSCSGGQTSLSLTLLPTTTVVNGTIYEVSNLQGSPIDVSSTNGALANTFTSGNATSTFANDIWFGAVAPLGGTVTGGGPAGFINNVSGTGSDGYLIDTATNTRAYSGNLSTTENYAAHIIAYKGTITGSGSLARAPWAFNGSGASGARGSGTLARAVWAFSSSGAVAPSGSGSLARAPWTFHGTGAGAARGVGNLVRAAWAFVASGQAIPPQLIIAIAAQAGTDDFGQAFPQGFTSFLTNVIWANLNSGLLTFNAGAANQNAKIGSNNVSGLINLFSGQINVGDHTSEFSVSAQQGGNPAQINANTDEFIVNANTVIDLNALTQIPAGSGPFIGGSGYTSLSTGGASGYARYRQMSWNRVEIDVELNSASTGTFTLGQVAPAPLQNRHFPLGVVGANNTGRLFVASGVGTIQAIIDGTGSWSGGATWDMPTD